MKGIIWKYLYTIALVVPLLAVVVVNNQWGTLFPRFLEAAKKLYQVTNDTESNTPISRLKDYFW